MDYTDSQRDEQIQTLITKRDMARRTLGRWLASHRTNNTAITTERVAFWNERVTTLQRRIDATVK